MKLAVANELHRVVWTSWTRGLPDATPMSLTQPGSFTGMSGIDAKANPQGGRT